jgi:hypothetical protein
MRRKSLPATRSEQRCLAEAARLRLTARARYRRLELTAELGREPTRQEWATDELRRADMLVRAEKLDPDHLVFDNPDCWRFLSAWNVGRPPGEDPI